jgi:hypothetical protein
MERFCGVEHDLDPFMGRFDKKQKAIFLVYEGRGIPYLIVSQPIK